MQNKKSLTTAVSFAALLLGTGVTELAQAGTLQDVKQRDAIRCGVSSDKAGFSYLTDDGHWKGMDGDLCRAVAAATLGDADKVEYVTTSAKNRFTAISSGEIDILSRATTWTAARDANLGADFTTPWFYDGQGVMTHADFKISKLEELDGATFCLSPGTTSEQTLADYFGRRGLSFKSVVIEKSSELYSAFQKGRCDAVTNDMTGLAARRTQFADPDAYTILPETISKEPLGAYVSQGDAQWRDIVTWTAFALMTAEELGVTSANVDEKHEASVSDNPDIARLLGTDAHIGERFGLSNDWAYQAIKQVGNYGEIFANNVGPKTPLKFERGLNRLWSDGGLLYPAPIR
ncbi:amino acid ABC transporter substrate-binding protein [Salinicola halophyticus]|uniref:amino acid ABC transporter substrate-binding protein n=1 Tax=Salinicola halophyticus TaxID=1808881 RepID=UPI003F4519C5